MSVEIAWNQNILVTDFYLLKSLLVVFGFGSQAFICEFSRQNINSDANINITVKDGQKYNSKVFFSDFVQILLYVWYYTVTRE